VRLLEGFKKNVDWSAALQAFDIPHLRPKLLALFLDHGLDTSLKNQINNFRFLYSMFLKEQKLLGAMLRFGRHINIPQFANTGILSSDVANVK